MVTRHLAAAQPAFLLLAHRRRSPFPHLFRPVFCVGPDQSGRLTHESARSFPPLILEDFRPMDGDDKLRLEFDDHAPRHRHTGEL
jgi:hypothetical protein